MKSKIYKFLLIIVPFLILELISQKVFLLYGETKYSIIFKIFNNDYKKITFNNYLINWDYSNNMMQPGKYDYRDSNGKVVHQYTINSRGFRGKEVDLQSDKFRIVALGGSTTIGLEVKDNETYPAQLESMLNYENKNYEVLNMGFGSRSLNFVKNLLYSEVFKYKPQMLIIYNNRNNIMYDASYNSIRDDDSYVDFNLDTRLIKAHFILQENLMIYRLLLKIYKRIVSLSLEANYLYSPYVDGGLREDYFINGYTDSLNEILKFCDKYDINKIVLVKQAYYINPEISKELLQYNVDELIDLYKQKYLIKKYGIEETSNLWLVLGTILNKKIDNFKNNKKVIIVDPVTKLIEDKNNFLDYIHLSKKGNEILAMEIFQAISNK